MQTSGISIHGETKRIQSIQWLVKVTFPQYSMTYVLRWKENQKKQTIKKLSCYLINLRIPRATKKERPKDGLLLLFRLHLYRKSFLMMPQHVLRVLLLVSCIATITIQTILDIKFQSFNTEYKWYTNLFPATMVTENQPTHNRMAKLFQTEKLKMTKSENADILQKSNTTARKRSLLPIGNLFITLYIFARIWQIQLYSVS